MPDVFVTYRRQDTGSLSRRLADVLSRAFGGNSVFIDTDSIRSAQNWQIRIREALRDARVLIVMIGPRWLHAQDEDGRRRIDMSEDWVRNEILHAIESGKSIMPILVGGAQALNKRALPECLSPLADIQAYEIKDEFWERDTNELIKRLEQLGLARASEPMLEPVPYPAKVDRAKALTSTEVEEALASLPEWRLITRPGFREGESERIELYRSFSFRSFEDAIHFIATAARYVSMTSHHPDWQNVWISIRVWLTTWDIGHKISFKDIRLAQYLETLYRDYIVS